MYPPSHCTNAGRLVEVGHRGTRCDKHQTVSYKDMCRLLGETLIVAGDGGKLVKEAFCADWCSKDDTTGPLTVEVLMSHVYFKKSNIAYASVGLYSPFPLSNIRIGNRCRSTITTSGHIVETKLGVRYIK